MATFRVLCAVAVMVSCCVIVYPRFVHPFVLHILGISEVSKTSVDENGYPPHYRTQNTERNKPPASPEDPRRNIRTAPHPGLRAAADMQKQTQPGSGRGMMGVVLPMYAIGIIVYLLYTLFKVFSKSRNNSLSREQGQISSRNKADNSVDRMGFPMTLESSADVHHFLHDQQQKQQLEELLARIDNKNVSLSEMKLLQKRLEETEAQMSRILQAMQVVQTNVDHMGTPEDQEQTQTQLNDLSPDMEGYELINRQGEVVEAKDKKVNRKKVETDIQKHKAVEPRTEFVKLNSQAGKLCKEVDFDDIDKDSDDDVECTSKDKDEEVENPDEDTANDSEDTGIQTDFPDSVVRQRKKQN